MEDLKRAFKDAGYPSHMVENISKKVVNSERTLVRKPKDDDSTLSVLPIRVISTFGSDEDLVSTVKKYEGHLSRTRSFSESDRTNISQQPTLSTPPHPSKKIFQFVKKTGSSLRSRLVNVKCLALGRKYGATKACKKKNCKCCAMVTNRDSFKINGSLVKTAPGTCSAYNTIYMIKCGFCDKVYIGRSSRPLRDRVGEHRRAFYQVTSGKKIDITNDDFSVGVHLYNDHGLTNRLDFNKHCTVCILDIASPYTLEVKEHKYIHLLKTLRPLGLNTTNPFKIPLLH